MNETPLAHFLCASCTRSDKCEIGPNETLFQAKARLRAIMSVSCPRREATAHLCPMRAGATPNLTR